MKLNLIKVLFFLFFFVEIHGQPTADADLAVLDSTFSKMVKDWDIPGLSIGIVKDGKIVFTGNYGVVEVNKNEKPSSQTLYAIASNSKAFTSTIIGMLVQEGKMDWDDKVKKYLPSFEMYDQWVSNHITIRDILCHRSGLGTFSGDNIWYKSNLSSKEIIERIKYIPQKYEFRSEFGYSNLMYITAGEIIETVTGKSWGENVKERILSPLGMNRTIWSVNELETKGGYASPHARKEGGNYEIPWVNWDVVASTGGLISCIEDLSKWMIFNLNNGIHNGDTLLSKKTRNLLWTPHTNHIVDHTSKNDFNKHFSAYGLGWSLSDYHGRLLVGHTGAYDGFITAITLIPDEKLVVVVLTNGMKSPIMAATYCAFDKFLGNKNKDWSIYYLNKANEYALKDTRIADRKAKRVHNTKPTVAVEEMIGNYKSDLCGDIFILKKGNKLRLEFKDYPLLSASLTHWNYNVWEIHWDYEHVWFSFGTIKVNTNNKLEVVGFDFDVPNDDFFFHELKPYRLNNKKAR